MGYRSEVAFIIEPEEVTASEFMQAFAADLPAEYALITKGYLKDCLDVRAEQVRFHADNVKWYASGLTGWNDDNYAEIDAYEALLEWAETRVEDARLKNQGAYARIGEEMGDMDTRYWGNDSYSLVNIQRFIDMEEGIA